MNELSDKFENSDENEDEIDDILYDLVRYGLVFKFHNNNQTIYSVPEEVAERTNHLKDSLDEDVELDVTSPAYMTAFINYARLLTSLYGVCSVDDVLEVYNRDFSESRFTKAFVIEQQPRIDDYVIDFVFTLDYMFYHSYLYNEDEIAEHILEERKQYTKMIPSPYNMEARLYCDDYDDVLPERAKVLDFLCRSFDDEDYAEAVVNDMIDEVRADYDLHKIMREIFEDDYFIFDIKKAELFLPLAIDLINAIHRWSLWGNSSNELL